jgi:hypothetical protein
MILAKISYLFSLSIDKILKSGNKNHKQIHPQG